MPPHIFKHVANHGDDGARVSIASTLQQTALIVRQRHAAQEKRDGETPGRKKLVVCTADHRKKTPGRRVMDERRKSRDKTVIEAYQNADLAWDFFRRVFNRQSIDDHGMTILSTVHYGLGFDNAMWDGQQMIYGDGDGVYFNRFTLALDVFGHEAAHGVTQSSARLEYSGQSGALNEHFSDVYGIMLKQWANNQRVDESDWIIGEGLFTSRVQGRGIRSMKAPGTAYDDPVLGRDPQPAHMRDYVHTSEDNGGVHINSGILNRAFYLAADDIGGQSWNVLGLLWDEVLTKRLTSRANFVDMVRETLAAAATLYGADSSVVRAITNAWNEVGLPVPAASRPRLPIKKTAAAKATTAPPPPLPKWRNRPAAAFRNTKERN